MPDKVEEFQRVGSDSGIVTGDSGKTPEIGHDKTE
jgi:hypothetical protein